MPTNGPAAEHFDYLEAGADISAIPPETPEFDLADVDPVDDPDGPGDIVPDYDTEV